MSILSRIKEKKITNRVKQRQEAFDYLFDFIDDDVMPVDTNTLPSGN